MRIGRAPDRRAESIIDMNLRSYTISRMEDGATNQYGSGGTESQYTDSHTEQLYLYFPDDSTVTVEQGEVTRGSLDGYALPDADIQGDDRVDHGGATYEIETVDGVPDDHDPVALELRLTRVTQTD